MRSSHGMLGEFGQRKTLFFYFLVFLKLYTWCCSRCYFALRQNTDSVTRCHFWKWWFFRTWIFFSPWASESLPPGLFLLWPVCSFTLTLPKIFCSQAFFWGGGYRLSCNYYPPPQVYKDLLLAWSVQKLARNCKFDFHFCSEMLWKHRNALTGSF